jgi:hypothetical protein
MGKNLWLENMKEREHLENLSIEGKILFMDFRDTGWNL